MLPTVGLFAFPVRDQFSRHRIRLGALALPQKALFTFAVADGY